MTLFTCDFEDCTRALAEHDVTQIHLCVHNTEMPADLAEAYSGYLHLDLCEEHLDMVLARILMSATSAG
jgi:hypothetical protein